MDPLPEEKHSRLGIASFTLAIIVAVAMLATFVIAGLLHSSHPDGPYPGQALVGIVAILLMLVDVVAVGLGIASISQSGVKKVFGILGLIFSALTVLGSIGLILLGLKMTGKM